MTKPKIVCFCGSSKFVDIMAIISWLIERDEGKITMGLHLLPHWYPNVAPDHLAEAEGAAEQMDELHLRKIDLSDEVFFYNEGGYMGESTTMELDYATKHGKDLRFLEPLPEESPKA